MGEYNFGGSTSGTGFTDNYVYSNGIDLPTARVAANGQRPNIVDRIAGLAGGRGASRSCVLSLGSASTSAFTIGSSSGAPSTGWRACSLFNTGGTAQFEIDCNGSFYFGRGGSGTNTFDSYGTSFSGTLGGSISYWESPNAPTGLSATPHPTTPGAVNLAWTAPSDNGGSAISGYRLEYATNSSFTGATAVSLGTGTTHTVTGLTPGTTYYFRIAAKNAVTEQGGTHSTYSSTTSVLVLSGMKVWNGTAWVPASVRVWDGSAWKAATVKVWNGSAWVNAV